MLLHRDLVRRILVEAGNASATWFFLLTVDETVRMLLNQDRFRNHPAAVLYFLSGDGRRRACLEAAVRTLEIDADGELIHASTFGNAALVAALLAHGGADPVAREGHALYSATMTGGIEVVRLLLNRIRPEEMPRPLTEDEAAAMSRALLGAASSGHTDIMKLLLAKWQVTDADGIALSVAKRSGHYAAVMLMIEAAATPQVAQRMIDIYIEA